MSIIEEMIDNIIRTRFEVFPTDVVQHAKDEVVDVVGCALGGANDTGSPMIVDLVREWGGSAESTILGHGLKAPSHNVALANAVMARSFDYGPVDAYVEGEVRPAHIGETMVPTALAIVEQKAMSGKQLLTALILGEDLASRIIAAPTEKVKGWDHTGTVNTFGATAVAGKLWGLDNRQLLNAFGIALNNMGGTTQGMYDRSSCWKLNQGLSAQRGVFSTRLAGKGFVGLKDPLTGSNGYFALFAPKYNPEVLTRHLGQKYYADVTFKPYPSCRGTHGPMECALEVVRKNHIGASDIEEVTIMYAASAGMRQLPEPFIIGAVPHVNAIFSYEYTVATAILRGYPKPEHFTEEAIKDPRIAEFIKKIKMTSQEFPNESFLAASIRIKVKGGIEYTEHVNVPKGNEIEHPLTREEKRSKFMGNASFSRKVSVNNAEKAMSMLEKLEEIEDVRKIIKLLVA